MEIARKFTKEYIAMFQDSDAYGLIGVCAYLFYLLSGYSIGGARRETTTEAVQSSTTKGQLPRIIKAVGPLFAHLCY